MNTNTIFHQRTAQRTGTVLVEEISRKQSLTESFLSFLTGTAKSRFGLALSRVVQTKGHTRTFTLGACRGRSAAQHRLPAEAEPSKFGVQRQFEADLRSNLHNVTCFQRRQVALISQRDVGFGGIRVELSVPCSVA